MNYHYLHLQLLLIKSRVKHLYIYPENGVEDYIFFACLFKNVSKTFQATYNNLNCFCCNRESKTIIPLEYQCLCHSCRMEQVDMLNSTLSMTIDGYDLPRSQKMRGVDWQCLNCSRPQISLFKD